MNVSMRTSLISATIIGWYLLSPVEVYAANTIQISNQSVGIGSVTCSGIYTVEQDGLSSAFPFLRYPVREELKVRRVLPFPEAVGNQRRFRG